ncbi:hypothetical protein ACLD0W_17035 [Alloalcanivorax sp. C16-1]|uniref:hypothetical protein n=1 Tax=Alloalcanivorax sp. C16-1 TaxID=3390051 RepID=UPI00397047A4
MRTLLRSAALAVLLLPLLGQAVERAGLLDLERQLWQIRTNFHMYGLMDGDHAYQATLEEKVAAVNDTLAAWHGEGETPAWLADVRGLWDGFDADPEREPARFDRVPVAMAERLAAVDDATDSGFDDVHALLAHLQAVTAAYTAIVAVNAGLPGEAESEDAFRAELAAFDQRLDQVQARHKGEAALAAALKETRVKWQFVRGSLVKFGADAVPFLVYRYSNRIGAELEGAIAPAG